ncbi:DUF6610 family protein [Candidatus Latescibacterota bacterium]
MRNAKKIPRYLTIREVEKLKKIPLSDVKFYDKILKSNGPIPRYKDKRSLQNIIFDSKQLYTIICLFYATGMRLNELASLNVTDINFERSVVRVFGKGSCERECFITESCMQVLEKWLKIRETRAHELNPALFINKKGYRRINNYHIQLKIAEYGKRAGINHKVSPHQLRHSVATHLLDKMHVYSLDCNRFTLYASFGDYFDGDIIRPHPTGGYENCIVDSIKNINLLWEDYLWN